MAAVIQLPYQLGAVPSGFKPTASPSSISKLGEEVLFPAGPSYLGHVRRQANGRSFADDDKAEEERLAAITGVDSDINGTDNDIGEEEEDAELLARDPKEWKSQDHYAVLGLSSLRYNATQDQIKIAHRKKVLKHHPDKKAGTGLVNDDSFFKCVAKAMEVLSNPERRRQFDSVDDSIDDDDVPSGKEKPEKFYALWGPVFAREGRFSKSQPVPSLGDANSSREEVDRFYDFFYNFDSWRSFEYLDKEINEGSDSRDDKRYTEKKNRNERARRKKEDNARVRNLVDKALGLDPRIKQFKEQEKAARAAKRAQKGPQANGNAANLEEEKKRKEEEERIAKEEAAKKEEQEKAARADAKKVREAAKKNLKKEKKALRTIITSSNYFQPAGTAASVSIIEAQLNELDALCAALEPEEVVALRERAEKAGEGAKGELAQASDSKGLTTGAFK